MQNDGLGDWRMQAATTLAKDAPAVYSETIVHKAGTPVYLTTLTKDASGGLIGFITPSPVALALSIATEAAAKAQRIREAIAFGDVMTFLGRGKHVVQESIPDLYDYFECCMIAVTFSFQALETHCNQIIADKLTGTYKLEREHVVKEYTAEELQRVAKTEEKLGRILPDILGVKTPRGRRVWHQFVELKRIRDTTVHLKAHDAYIRDEIDRGSLFHQFFQREMDRYPRFALEMIDFFSGKEPSARWLSLAKQKILHKKRNHS